MPVFVIENAIMSLITIRKKPPVSTPTNVSSSSRPKPFTQSLSNATQLLLTILTYSSSVGHSKESLHSSSAPCPRWRDKISAETDQRSISVSSKIYICPHSGETKSSGLLYMWQVHASNILENMTVGCPASKKSVDTYSSLFEPGQCTDSEHSYRRL